MTPSDSLSVLIATPRLRLRGLTLADAAFILELVNEPAWIEFIGDKGVRTLDDACDYLRRGPLDMYRRFGFGLMLVERIDPSGPIGICGFIQREGWEEVDLGFAFLQRFHGRGFGEEAASAVLAHGEQVLGFNRVLALTAPHNVRSIRLLERLGFRYERFMPATKNLRESNVFVRVRDATGGA